MTVSKRLRYEILLRDNHTCRYCGASAPDVKMNIDHVQPKALGGSDEPANLVAACTDCNSGKSSSSATASQVAAVSDDAVRWAAAIKQAAEETSLNRNTEVYEAVVAAWTSYRRKQIPADYMETIDQFINAGLPAEDIVKMARVADAKPSIYDRWAYFCGCCWTRLTTLQERAREIVSGPPSPPPLTIWTRWTEEDLTYLLTLQGVEVNYTGGLFECEDHFDGLCETDTLCQIASAARTRESLEALRIRKYRAGLDAEKINDAADEAEEYVYG